MDEMSHRLSVTISGSRSKSHVYVLRIWRAADDRGAQAWRVLLRRADESKAIGFANVDGLLAFLTEHYRVSPSPASPAQPTEDGCIGN